MKLKNLLLLCFGVLAIAFGFFFSGKVSAQSVEDEAAAKHGVTFPISQLGNCKNYTECRNFCEDPINHDACVAFAKSKGFYKESEVNPSQAIIEKAKGALGCDSAASCKDFCGRQENFDKCHNFAQSAGLGGGYKEDPTKGEVLSKAKETLGCNSYDSCKSFCDNPTNRDKCSQFAQSAGVNGGYEYKGPGGCTTETTCREFCQKTENAGVCSQFSQDISSKPNFDPQAECKKYSGCSWNGSWCQCQNNQADQERMKSECVRYSGCTWAGSNCQCASSGAGSYTGNTMSRDQQEAICKSGGGSCTWNNDICNCQGYHSTGSYSTTGQTPLPAANGSLMTHDQQEATCKSGGGTCDWTTGMCNCKGYNSTNYYGTGGYATPYAAPYSTSYPTSYPTSGSTMSRDQQQATCTSGGGTCTWNGDICNCQGYHSPSNSAPAPTTSYDPATMCAQSPGCSWTGSTCQCSSVQGAATVYFQTWWQKLLDLLKL